MSNIRVTYSGLISLTVGLSSIITGLIFTLIVTRELSQTEFGAWNLIGGFFAYVLILDPIVSFWTTREVARGSESGRTAVVSSGLFSMIAVFVYLLIIVSFPLEENIDKNILFFAAILIPLTFIQNIFYAICLGYKPHIAEYGFITFELTKIPTAFLFIYFLQLGLTGLILAVALSNLASIIILSIKIRHKILGSFRTDFLKKWVKRFWLPIYPRISQTLTDIDVVVFTILSGSVGGLAYWGTAKAIALIVGHSKRMNKALYPKLLESNKKEYFQENLTQVFYFSIPLTATSIVFSRPALFALNPLYEGAVLVVVFLSFVFFQRSLGNIFTQSLWGLEKVDTKQDATFKDFLKSKLFSLPTLRIIQRGGYLAILVIVLLIFNKESDLDLVIYWSLTAMLTQIPFTLYLFSLVKREFSLKIDKIPILKYLFSSFLVFGFTYLLTEQYLEYKISIFEFLPTLIPYLVFSTLAYLGLTFLIDSKTRILFKSVLNEIKNKSNHQP